MQIDVTVQVGACAARVCVCVGQGVQTSEPVCWYVDIIYCEIVVVMWGGGGIAFPSVPFKFNTLHRSHI